MFLTPRRVISRFRIRFPGTGDNIGERIEQILSVRNENVEEHWGFREVPSNWGEPWVGSQ